MRIEDFNERLKHKILVADGAMGSLLHEAAGPQRSLEEMNSTHAELVFGDSSGVYRGGRADHRDEHVWREPEQTRAAWAGRARRGVESPRRENCPRSARIGKARSPDCRVNRPAWESSDRYAICPTEEVAGIFKEQAGALEERGVDFFLLETFVDLEELQTAVDAIRSFSRLPVVAQMTYTEEGTAFGGGRPQDVWEKLKDKNIQGIGANCTIGPQSLLPILRELAGCAALPLSVMPNVGFPKRIGDRIVYPRSSPEYFALFAKEAAEIGRAHYRRVLRDDARAHPSNRRSHEKAASGAAIPQRNIPTKACRSAGGGRTSAKSRGTRAGERALGQDSDGEICGVGGD